VQAPVQASASPSQSRAVGSASSPVTAEARPETPRPAPAPTASVPAAAAGPQRPVASAPGESELRELVQAGWDKFLVLAGKRCGVKVQAALRGVREIEVQGQAIVFLFQPSQGFSRDVVNQQENRVQVENVLAEQLGRHVQIRCALLGDAPAAAGDSGASAKPGRKSAPAASAAGDAASPGEADEALLDDARKRGAVITPLKNEGKHS
jgi:hypothetical protein